MIKLEQIKMNIGFSKDDLIKKCSEILKISQKDIKSIKIIKQAIDARRKPKIFYVVNVALKLNENTEKRFKHLIYQEKNLRLEYAKKTIKLSPVIIGFGPSGMFAGLAFARMGFKPIIIEQGNEIEQREKDVQDFWKNRKLNKYSNVQFGEGGAGTFSDGKLNSNLDNDYCKMIINELCYFNAPEEISYQSKPHIGSDKLREVVKNLRNEIIALGGTIKFATKFEDFCVKNGKIDHIIVKNLKNNKTEEIKTDTLLLCVGHSARDVFKLLYDKGVNLKQKPFAMGVRIEQRQEDINKAQYGENYDKRLPPADYKLVTHLSNGRSVFTFCMCPGGNVVASSSDEGEIVTNGMSYYARNNENANSAVLVNITPEDYNSSHPLAGVEYQAKYEKLAFILGGSNFNAPAQSVGQFMGKNIEHNINYSYRPNITIANIEKCLPSVVSSSLKEALPILNKKLKNFAKDENLLIAIESRSSCPLTILRDENFECNIKGIYPVGEGAGYAGGIISSAQDGIKVAESIYNRV